MQAKAAIRTLQLSGDCKNIVNNSSQTVFGGVAGSKLVQY
jgi:hypothetical protein